MAYRRERNIRDIYEERFIQERGGAYPREPGLNQDRRSSFSRPEEVYGRGGGSGGGGFDYDNNNPRFYPNGGGPRNYHGEDQRGYHGDVQHFPADRRAAPPARREEPFVYRGPREESHPARQVEFRSSRPPPPPHAMRGQMFPSLPASASEGADDTLMQAIRTLADRSEDRDSYRRKGVIPPPAERSPVARDVLPSPHSRSGSSVSSRSYSPDRAKNLPYPSQGKNKVERIPGLSPRENSPVGTPNPSIKEEPLAMDEREEAMLVPEEPPKVDDFRERRSQIIATRAQEIEKTYRQDCETIGMVVRMLVSKDASLEKLLQGPLKENLSDIRERCLTDLKDFISDLDNAVQMEPSG